MSLEIIAGVMSRDKLHNTQFKKFKNLYEL